MTDHPYPLLFSPFQLGHTTLRNRVATTAHFTSTCVDGIPTDRTIAYYRERARGGVALIIVEANWVSPPQESPHAVNAMACYRDEIIPHYQRLSSAVHAEGAAILCQLNHDGTYGLTGPSSMVVFTTSAKPGVAHALDRDEIHKVVADFVAAARRLQVGGFDGIEISAAHGLFVHAFLTPLLNQRTDEYGGTLTNRMRLLVEILTGVREAVGRHLLLGVRLSGSDFATGGLEINDVQQISQGLEAGGLIDYLNITGGVTHLPSSVIMHAGHMDDPHGQLVPLAAAVKSVVKLPILHASRIRTPLEAEQVLAQGHADLIGMTRAHISDPHLVRKAVEGRAHEILICVGCEEGCTERITRGEHITCVHNPQSGRESHWGPIESAPVRRKVVVVGGGPAGLEAARVAAARGHQVVLLEKQTELGGKVLIAAKAPLMHEFAGIAQNLISRLATESVDVRTGVEATEATITTLSPDVVILAMGARPYHLDVPQDGTVTLAYDEQVLEEQVEPGPRVVVVDGEGRYRALNTGIFLTQRDRHVIFVTEYPMLGARFTVDKFRVRPYQKLLDRGVRLGDYLGEKVIAMTKRSVTIENVYTHTQRTIDDVDTVVTAFHGRSNQVLYDALKSKVPHRHLIGDAYSPRSVEHACYEGHQVARTL